MSLKNSKPRPLFTLEDDGLFQRLEFSDSDDLEFPSHKFQSPVKREISPVRRDRNRSSMSPSDDEQLDSSTDSAMGDLCFSVKRPTMRRKFTKTCVVSAPGSTPPYRKVRALRLFGSPKSPKTLLNQSEIHPINNKPRPEKCVSTPIANSYDHNHNLQRFRRSRIFSPILGTNINPFTQNPVVLNTQIKRRRDSGICRVPNNLEYLEK